MFEGPFDFLASLSDTIAFAVKKHLHTMRKVFAQSFHIVVSIKPPTAATKVPPQIKESSMYMFEHMGG